MSNRVDIVRTEFRDIRGGSISYGFRCYDDYGQSYMNRWESIGVMDDDVELLQAIDTEGDDQAQEMIDFAIEQGNAVYVDGIPYVKKDGKWVEDEN